MLGLCSSLELVYNPDFEQRFGRIRLSGDSGRSSNVEISPRPRREVPEQVKDEIESSNSYVDLISRLGY